MNIKDYINIEPFNTLNKDVNVYLVGGIVRDYIMKCSSKDIDVLVENIDINELETHLNKYGTCDLVGVSFGILKFKYNDIVYDVAVPRKDSRNIGHHVNVSISKNYTLEDDLIRRDFTINSLAMNMNGDIIDLFGGINDIKNKIIRATSIDTFSEDPLRILRAIQFSARFNFDIDFNTNNMIKNNIVDLNTISKERFIIEFEKIYKKNYESIKRGLELIKYYGIDKLLFGKECDYEKYPYLIDKDMIYVLSNDIDILKNLKYDNKVIKYVEGINKCLEYKNKYGFFKGYNICNDIIYSSIVNKYIYQEPNIFTLKDLAINGNDLKDLNIPPKKIGYYMDLCVYLILEENLNNNKTDLINYITKEEFNK